MELVTPAAVFGSASAWQVIPDLLRTLAVLAVPVVVAWMGYRLNIRIKAWEASQWRNQELIKARLGYYQAVAPALNDLMCFFTFIGRWKELAPPDVIRLKRDLDRQFYSALPLFSEECGQAYEDFMDACSATYGPWGDDAKLRTGYVRRRAAAGGDWLPAWEQLFNHAEDDRISRKELTAFRTLYDGVLGALAKDM